MNLRSMLSAATVVLLTAGMVGLGAPAAFADDTPPAADPVVETAPAPEAPPASEAAAAPAPAPAPAPASDPAPDPALAPDPAPPVTEPDPVTEEPVIEEPVVEEVVAARGPNARTTSVGLAAAAPNYIETSHVLTTNGVDITLHNVSPWIYPTTVKIDGVSSYGPTLDNRTDTDGNGSPDLNGPQKDASKTRSIVFDVCSGTHTVSYRVDAGSEKDLYQNLPVGTWTDLSITAPCTYVTVAWLAPGGAPPNHFAVPQSYLFSQGTATPMLGALDGAIAAYLARMTCGTDADIQVDVYFDTATTTSLIAGGHLDGPDDPDEDLIAGGEGTAWKFVHLDAPDCVKVVPDVPLPKDLCGDTDDHYGLPANETGITYSRNGLHIVATLGAGYIWGTLPAGYVDNHDGTATYAFGNFAWTNQACPIAVTPDIPEVKDLCETLNDHYGLPADETGITYTRSGLDIVATLGAGYVWDTLPAGYIDNLDGTATYAFSNTRWTNVPCLPTAPLVVPLAVKADPTCNGGASYTLSSDQPPGAVLWTVDGTPGFADGPHSATVGSTITVEAAPNAPTYGFGFGQQTTWILTFNAPTGCLDTLALTGSAPLQMGGLAGMLMLGGLIALQSQSRNRASFRAERVRP